MPNDEIASFTLFTRKDTGEHRRRLSLRVRHGGRSNLRRNKMSLQA